MSQSIMVGITACHRMLEFQSYHVVGEKYVTAVLQAVGAMPILLPPIREGLDLEMLYDRLDGIVLTGSPSNIEPHHYCGTEAVPPYDVKRDETTLPLVRFFVERGMPLLAICRGFQEVNVALGGTLVARIQDEDNRIDHRAKSHLSVVQQYLPAHEVMFTRGGLLESIAGATTAKVNSLHQQGIDRLANGLTVEAQAPDGLIEAFRGETSSGFVLGVQWHPEWKAKDNQLSLNIFRAFGDACRERLKQ